MDSVVYFNGDDQGVEDVTIQQRSASSFGSPNTPITRTVAIIKYHALEHRFDIERRIQEAGFEIVKERQMEFDTETDPETLEELFGEDTHNLAEGPVWVYILERRRAVEVWHALMGPRDPEVARHENPSSLRAVYGISAAQNGLMGSQDMGIAEIQIASLFASSPPFPPTDLPPEDGEDQYDAVRASIMDSLSRASLDGGYAPSSATNPSTVNGSSTRLNANGKPAFRARPVPSSVNKPDIVPRMTKAAALRTGQAVVEKTSSGPRKPVTKERLAQTFANVPGHKRAETISVASTAAPTIAPRMTRAAALRLGIAPTPQPTRTRSATTDDISARKDTFEGVPGHKRRESISVASVKAPTVAPRLNKSASLRTQPKQNPPTSFMFKTATPPKVPGSMSRAHSMDSMSPSRTRPASQMSNTPSTSPQASPAARRSAPAPRPQSISAARQPSLDPPRTRVSRTASVNGTASTTKASVNNADSDEAPPPPPSASQPGTPVKAPRPRPSSVCGASPSIAPRMNRSASLRAAKMEAEAAATAAALAKKTRVRAPPSSFKTIAT